MEKTFKQGINETNIDLIPTNEPNNLFVMGGNCTAKHNFIMVKC